jgi:Ni,Fe-hydrogenase III large subunit
MAPESLLEFLGRAAPLPQHRPWPRFALDATAWLALRERLAEADWSLVGLWAEYKTIHVALRDEVDGAIAVASLAVDGGRYPSLAAVRPAAQRLERALGDLFGIVPDGLPDARPWLDHGAWATARPLALSPLPQDQPAPYEFLAAEGESLHQIPVGPVHAGIIEPGHFRFHANGETVVRLEQRLGYAHKGIEKLMQGQDVAAAARLAARLSGDSTVAHSLAFAKAVEAALDAAPPLRAVWLRAVMAELERIANHLGDIGAIANDATFSVLHAHCAMLREHALRTADAAFGHRLMMDRVIPGGVAADLSPAGKEIIRDLLEAVAPRFEALVRIYDNASSLADRTVGTGVVPAQLVHRFGAGGYVGRASGRPLDARLSPGYAPYDELAFEVPTHTDGDVNARVWIRIREVQASLGLLRQLLDRLPEGDIAINLTTRGGEGMALVEGFRGEIMTWVRLDAAGRVARCHPRDPSWFQWPLLEAAVENNIVADFPLCNKSFNCSYSGHDL